MAATVGTETARWVVLGVGAAALALVTRPDAALARWGAAGSLAVAVLMPLALLRGWLAFQPDDDDDDDVAWWRQLLPLVPVLIVLLVVSPRHGFATRLALAVTATGGWALVSGTWRRVRRPAGR